MSTLTTYTDEELLALVAGGDEGAFNSLFERYRQPLYYFLLRHTKSPGIAEELVTDIFMKLWTGRELTARIEHLSAFLYKIAYHKAMSFLRTTARHAKLNKLYVQRAGNAEAPVPDDIAIHNELKQLILQAVNQLPPQRKLIYQLSREEGLSHDQIAEALHISRNTVSNSITSATRSIARHLEAHSTGKAALSVFILFA